MMTYANLRMPFKFKAPKPGSLFTRFRCRRLSVHRSCEEQFPTTPIFITEYHSAEKGNQARDEQASYLHLLRPCSQIRHLHRDTASIRLDSAPKSCRYDGRFTRLDCAPRACRHGGGDITRSTSLMLNMAAPYVAILAWCVSLS